jgi:hypothetical protein
MKVDEKAYILKIGEELSKMTDAQLSDEAKTGDSVRYYIHESTRLLRDAIARDSSIIKDEIILSTIRQLKVLKDYISLEISLPVQLSPLSDKDIKALETAAKVLEQGQKYSANRTLAIEDNLEKELIEVIKKMDTKTKAKYLRYGLTLFLDNMETQIEDKK